MKKVYYKEYTIRSRQYDTITDLRKQLVDNLNSDMRAEDIISISEEHTESDLKEGILKAVVYYRAM